MGRGRGGGSGLSRRGGRGAALGVLSLFNSPSSGPRYRQRQEGRCYPRSCSRPPHRRQPRVILPLVGRGRRLAGGAGGGPGCWASFLAGAHAGESQAAYRGRGCAGRCQAVFDCRRSGEFSLVPQSSFIRPLAPTSTGETPWQTHTLSTAPETRFPSFSSPSWFPCPLSTNRPPVPWARHLQAPRLVSQLLESGAHSEAFEVAPKALAAPSTTVSASLAGPPPG